MNRWKKKKIPIIYSFAKINMSNVVEIIEHMSIFIEAFAGNSFKQFNSYLKNCSLNERFGYHIFGSHN